MNESATEFRLDVSVFDFFAGQPRWTSLVTLIGSGFDALKTRSPVGPLPAPQNLRLDYTGRRGELQLKLDRVPNANNELLGAERAKPGWAMDGRRSLDDEPREHRRSHAGQSLLGARLRKRQPGLERMGGPTTETAV